MKLSSLQPLLPSSNLYLLHTHAEIEISQQCMDKLKIMVTEDSEMEDVTSQIEEYEGIDDDEDEFSFCTVTGGSQISADDAFQNGQIRPVFPIFNQDLLFEDHERHKYVTSGDYDEKKMAFLRPPLKKVFVGETEKLPEGAYCEWKEKTADVCKKNNSTGFSKLWKIRDLGIRSNSDGKDSFVFLQPSAAKSAKVEKALPENSSGAVKGKAKGVKGETASLMHQRHYERNRAMNEGQKRRSYLPYRPELVGFFTSVNGMTKNVHPF